MYQKLSINDAHLCCNTAAMWVTKVAESQVCRRPYSIDRPRWSAPGLFQLSSFLLQLRFPRRMMKLALRMVSPILPKLLDNIYIYIYQTFSSYEMLLILFGLWWMRRKLVKIYVVSNILFTLLNGFYIRGFVNVFWDDTFSSGKCDTVSPAGGPLKNQQWI